MKLLEASSRQQVSKPWCHLRNRVVLLEQGNQVTVPLHPGNKLHHVHHACYGAESNNSTAPFVMHIPWLQVIVHDYEAL